LDTAIRTRITKRNGYRIKAKLARVADERPHAEENMIKFLTDNADLIISHSNTGVGPLPPCGTAPRQHDCAQQLDDYDAGKPATKRLLEQSQTLRAAAFNIIASGVDAAARNHRVAALVEIEIKKTDLVNVSGFVTGGGPPVQEGTGSGE